VEGAAYLGQYLVPDPPAGLPLDLTKLQNCCILYSLTDGLSEDLWKENMHYRTIYRKELTFKIHRASPRPGPPKGWLEPSDCGM
jgi:hypothetical protein